MMRDDALKRRMRAIRPLPTPMFSGRIRQVLDRLPERKKQSILRFLPAAAMAAVAVAVIGLAVMSQLGPGGSPFSALTEGRTEATPQPTPAAVYQAGEKPFASLNFEEIKSIRMIVHRDSQPPEAPAPYPYKDADLPGELQMLAGILYGVEVKGRIDLEQIPVGSTRYLLVVNMQDDTVMEINLYGDHNLFQSGITYEIGNLPDMDAAFDALEGDVLLMGGEAAPTAAPGATEQPAQETTAPTPAPETPEATILPTPAPTAMMSEAEAEEYMNKNIIIPNGNCALGYDWEFTDAVETDGGMDYVIKGQTSEGLIMYSDRYYKAKKNSPKKHEIDPMVYPGLMFVLIDGRVDESHVDTISEERLNLLIAANEDSEEYNVYTRGILGGATLEFLGPNEYETFVLTIHNTNPDFRPTSDFTILTRYAPEDGKVQYFAFYVKAK